MRKMLVVLLVLVSVSALATAVAHADGKTMLSPTSSSPYRLYR
ncbi:MAG: hypothetical protein ACOY93_02255 [Bacillota bacterium]